MTQSKQDPRMAFECQQYDHFASLNRSYVLLYYYNDSTVEMLDRVHNKTHLKRTPIPLQRNELFIGANVNIFGNPTQITGYADEVTRRLCEEIGEMTIVIIAESAFASLGRYVSVLTEECGFTVANLQMCWVQEDQVNQYQLPVELNNTRVTLVQAVRASAVEKGLDFVKRSPGTCAAETKEEVDLWKELVAEAARKPLGIFDENNSSVVILKPHLIRGNRAGTVIQQLIDLELEPTGLTQLSISSNMADHFLKPYQGVLPNLQATIHGLEGTAWVLQLVSLDDSKDVVNVVRAACGPYDPVIAKKLYPTTIRAKFGVDQGKNAVHCCDLPGDGPVYAKFFFKK